MHLVKRMRSVRNIKLTSVLLLALGLNVACRQEPTPQSGLDSVDIPQSSVKDQGRAGFCWAYATVGFVEQFHLDKFGKELDFSEEALAFHMIADHLTMQAISVASGYTKIENLTEANLFDEGYNLKVENLETTGSFGLLSTYGVVPESEWSMKFTSEAQMAQLRRSVLEAFKQYVTGMKKGDIKLEDIAQKVLVGADRFPSVPPTRLANGASPRDYLMDTVKFNPEEFEAVTFRTVESYDSLVELMKQALYRKIPVPITFPIDWTLGRKGFGFSGNPVQPLPQGYKFNRVAGHVVIITDWVNRNEKPGPLPQAELEKALQAPGEFLDYVVVKNSWGTGSGADALPKGYHKMDQLYMRFALEAGEPIALLVPKGLPFSTNPQAFPDRDPAFHPVDKGFIWFDKIEAKATVYTPFTLPDTTQGCQLQIGSNFRSIDLDGSEKALTDLKDDEKKVLAAAALDSSLAAKTVFVKCQSNSHQPNYLKFLMSVSE